MESTTGKRVRESRRSEQSKRQSYSSSPAPRSSQKKPRKVKSSSEHYWPLKDPGILDEKFENNKWYYLVAWADIDPATGKEYTPSWEPYNNVTEDERAKWQKRKLESSQEQIEHPSSPIDSTQESEPIRPAKRKRGSPSRPISSAEEPSRKILRVDRREAASPDVTGEYRVKHKTEIKDSYEDEPSHLSSYEVAGPLVEVPINEDLNRTIYAKLPPSSQLSQSSSQPGESSSSFCSPPPRPKPSRFIWDEDIIPDSQDLNGSELFVPIPTQSSSYLPTSSQSVTSGFARPQSQFEQEQHSERPISNRSNKNFGISSGQSHHSPLWRNSPEIEESQSQARAPERLISSVTSLPSVRSLPSIQSISSAHSRDKEQGQSQRNQLPSSPLFQTQVPFKQTPQQQSPLFVHSSLKSALKSRVDLTESQTKEEAPSTEQSSPSALEPLKSVLTVTESRTKGEASSTQQQSALPPREALNSKLNLNEPQKLGGEPSTTLFVAPTQRSSSSYWETRGASKFTSSNPSSENQHYTTRTISVASLLAPQNTIDRSHDSNSGQSLSLQHSLPISQDKSSSSHLPSPPFEHIISSIEPATDNLLSSRPATPAGPSPFRTPKVEANQSRTAETPDSSFSNLVEIMDESQNPQSSAGLRQMIGYAQIPSRGHAERDARNPPAISSSAPASYTQQVAASNNMFPLQQSIENRTPVVYPPVEVMPDVQNIQNNSQEEFEEPDEYVVPLPMVSHPRDIYVGFIRNYRNFISSFLHDEVFDTSLVRTIDYMLEELQKLCDHQNLHEDISATQIFDDEVVQAKWAENISTKCMFLAEFLMLMESTDRNIIVLVRPGRMLQILEAVFKLHGFVYSIAGQAGVVGDIDTSLMRITLLPTTGQRFDVAADLIVAFDATHTEVPNLEALRENSSYPNQRIPLISLVIIHSVEHLEKCYSRDMEPIQRKISIVGHLNQLGDNVGKLPHGGEYLDPPKAANAIFKFFMNGANPATWPIPPLPELEDLEYESQQSREQQSSAPAYYNSSSLVQPPASAIKRPLDDDAMQSESPKRPRLSPSPMEAESPHISETALHASASIRPNGSANPVSSFSEGGDESLPLLKRLQSLEIQLKAKESREAELVQMADNLQFQCDDLRASITQIQPKYQEALNDRGLFEHERNLATAREAKATQALEAKIAAFDKIKNEKAVLDEELAIARKTLSESTIPSIATLEALRAEIASLKEANARLEKNKESSASTLKYLQEAYQNASSATVETNAELTELKAQNEILKRKADENAVRIHEIQRDGEREFLRSRIKTLKEEVKDRERQLEKAAREKEAMNLRRGTRGASTGPRSPRMGTMSPSARLGGVQGRFAAAGNGSRGNSPAPNELGMDGAGVFRGGWGPNSSSNSVVGASTRVGGFGEVLFAQDREVRGERGPVRFGNHLQ